MAFAAAVVVGGPAFTDELGPTLELASEPGFTERFAGNAQVSGQFLSGLAYQSGTDQVDLNQLRLSFTRPSEDVRGRVCVRLTSDDGRYWASNLYRSSGTFTSSPAVPIPTRYGEEIKSYGPSSLLMLATFSETCNETTGKVFVPGFIGSRAATADLVAYVNVSQSKVSAALTDESGLVLEKVTCRKPAGGSKVTFSHLCNIPVSGAFSGSYKLIVGVKGLTGKLTEQEYAIHLE
ncbi:hypothetical protein [Pseudorhizobium flavum]|uniref:hypothetical protein n=1 Tax=Pseudorhizobium flavum TaxID=1335061 RepID=UPI00376F70CB